MVQGIPTQHFLIGTQNSLIEIISQVNMQYKADERHNQTECFCLKFWFHIC